jgi:hypothetical protein
MGAGISLAKTAKIAKEEQEIKSVLGFCSGLGGLGESPYFSQSTT